MRGWSVALLVAATLAGCTSDDGGNDPDEAPGAAPGPDGLGPAGTATLLAIGSGSPHTANETFTGTFAFQDNRQYMGQYAGEAGQAWTHQQEHDLSGLLPSGMPFQLTLLAEAATGSGDIDAFLVGDAVAESWCDCPFGGRNEVRAYGLGDSNDLRLVVQFDEIHGEPTDTGVPAQGFDYTVQVAVVGSPGLLPPGVPLGLRLEAPGDSVTFTGHTQPITVYDPADAQIGVLGADSDGTFTLDQEMPTGEYIFLQQLNGAPATATTTRGDGTTEPPAARFIGVVSEAAFVELPDGQPGETTFVAPPTVIEIGGCGFGGDVEVDPAFVMLDPDGQQWAASASSGPAIGGWGTCTSNWLGSPDQQPGTWTLRFTDTAGHERGLFHFYSAYER
ncbi:MAG: hypothetical protein ACPGQL_02195 [Thermoplasmatota archaeon]